MADSLMPMYRLWGSEKKSRLVATYHNDDGTKVEYALEPVVVSKPALGYTRLRERLQPIANRYDGQVRRDHDGKTYQVVGVGSDVLHDDNYLICLPQGEASTDLRCWPLNEFERLAPS